MQAQFKLLTDGRMMLNLTSVSNEDQILMAMFLHRIRDSSMFLNGSGTSIDSGTIDISLVIGK